MAPPKTSLRERFERHVRRGADDECHYWTGGKTERGYGVITVKEFSVRAHRLAWVFENGPAGGLCVLHSCDNPSCVNPNHLFLGTQQDNNTDKARKWRGTRGKLPFGVNRVGRPCNPRPYSSKFVFRKKAYYFGKFATAEEASAVAVAEKTKLLQLHKEVP